MLVTHDLPVVAQICDRAAVMYAGEIVECGPMETLFHQPRHPYTRLLFAATPDLYGREEVVSIPARRRGWTSQITGCPFRPRCDVALDRCAEEHPALRLVGPGHEAACHHAERAALDVTGSQGVPLLEVENLTTLYPVRRGLD